MSDRVNAADDSAETTEDSTVFISIFANDEPVEPPRQVRQVNGARVEIGEALNLPAGGRLQVTANGVIFDPENDFQDLPSGETTTVTFTYQSGSVDDVDIASLNGTNGFVLTGIDSYDISGRSVSGAGDVNGDGIADLIIGVSGANASYVVFGRTGGFAQSVELSSLDGTTGFVINGIDFSDSTGRSVSGAGDINGDGIDDLIIGAEGADPGGRGRAGESYVVFGRMGGFAPTLELSSLDGTNGFTLNGVDPDDRSGRSVSGAGDINGDGIDDLIIGAPGANVGGQIYAGESYVVFGQKGGFEPSLELSDLDGTTGFLFKGSETYDYNGFSVSDAGDINGDGIDDLIIGAYRANGEVGESYVVFGRTGGFGATLDRSSLNGATGFVISGIDGFDRSGVSVSGAGDVNGDGLDDLIIGASFAYVSGTEPSTASYVVFGRREGFAASLKLSSLDGITGFVIDGIETNNEDPFSFISVSGAGDINGDGIEDLIIGAPYASLDGAFRAGKSYVVFGRSSGFAPSLDLSTLDSAAGFVLRGTTSYTYSGRSVSGAGDINGDGIDDLIIGSSGPDNRTVQRAGESYVVFGGPDIAPRLSNEATVTVIINGVNDAPVLVDDTASVAEGDGPLVIDVLANDTDVDAGDTLTIASLDTDGFELGTVAITNGRLSFTYTGRDLAAGQVVSDSFSYTVTDTEGATATATVTVTITGKDGIPVTSLTNGNDTSSGNNEANIIRGLGGDDVILGNGGNDSLQGDDGNDILSGGVGNDSLRGGNGNDNLNGGTGNDTVVAGMGNDTLAGGRGSDMFVVCADGLNTIADFRVEDVIELEDSIFTSGEDAYDALIFGSSGAFLDVDGDGSADLFLAGVISPVQVTMADFIIG